MKEIKVKLINDSYKIFLDNNFDVIKNILLKNKFTKLAIITDENIDKLGYLEKIKSAIGRDDIFVKILTSGEEYKNLDTVKDIYEFCIENNLDRKSFLIALGGGVVGDMTGFAASTYLRGISFAQIPTTLLAQVDASIGGKTGVDLSQGKNLVGAFYQPKFVYINPKFLKTLDEREYKSGLAEVVKYAVIYDAKFFEYIERNIDAILQRDEKVLFEIIYRCAKTKASVVSKDERESDLRRILNFGHTFGHALEGIENYSNIKHGEAVAVGMVFAARLAKNSGILNDDNLEARLFKIVDKLCFNDTVNMNIIRQKFENNIYSVDNILGFMQNDKKMLDNKINFVLPTKIGKVKIVSLDMQVVRENLIAIFY